jgi:predicted HD phosphohydrolase
MAGHELTSVERLLTVLADGARSPDEGDVGAEPAHALDHHLQCAHRLRLEHPDDLELQIAGLVHDVGSALVPGDEAGHGRLGADAIRALLGPRVARLVELHVPAKRYLTAIDPAYRARLSPASTASLVAQGGTMGPEEAASFAVVPELAAALALRSADEAAKVPGRAVPTLLTWRPTVEAVAAAARMPTHPASTR